MQHPGPAERGRQLHAAVGQVPARVLIGQLGPGPLVHLRGQRGQLLHPQPRLCHHQELIGLVPELLRQPVGPQADQPPTDAETCPAARAANTRGWVAARLAHAVWPTAAPLVTWVWWISQDRAL